MKAKLKSFVLLLILATALLSACAPSQIPLSPSFWTQKDFRVGVASMVHPKPGAHRLGPQGLIDLMITAGTTSSLEDHVAKFEIDDSNNVLEIFATEMQNRGFQTQVLTSQIDFRIYERFVKPSSATSGEFFQRNLYPLAVSEAVDVLLLFYVDGHGSLRNYYGFLPLAPPQGYFQVSGWLIDLRSNQLLWRKRMSQEQSVVPVEGEWDQPPDYPNLKAAIKKASSNAWETLLKDFFGQVPMRRTN